MSSLSEFFEKTIEIVPLGYFKHPTTGNIRKNKFKKNAMDKLKASHELERLNEDLKLKILEIWKKDKSLPWFKCTNCGESFPKISEYNGHKIHFVVKNGINRNGSQRYRTRCGVWGNNCDAENDRKNTISPTNPTGKRNYKTDKKRYETVEKFINYHIQSKRKDSKRGAITSGGRYDEKTDIVYNKEGVIIFNLNEKEECENFFKQNGVCPKTGIKYQINGIDVLNYYYNPDKRIRDTGNQPSLDRIVSNKYYTKDNVQWTSLFYNKAKGNSTDEEMLILIEQIKG